jgi:hypothetical protein
MRIVDIRHDVVPISRYADPALPSGGLDTSIAAVVTDVVRDGALEARGWPRSAFWPHGGHLFCLHVVSALGLGGAEMNPLCFQPFGGLPDGATLEEGRLAPPEAPGIGFETKAALHRVFRALVAR